MNPITSRRVFIQRGLALLAAAPTIPTFLDQTIWAMTDPLDMKRTQQASGKDGQILVILQLAGGNDALNMVIPYSDDLYHRARPTMGVDAKSVMKLDDRVGLHPNLAPLKNLYDAGQMSVLQGVGYPNPNRSHFRATDIWESAEPTREDTTTGWLGRFFDNTCSGVDPHEGIALGAKLPLAMQGDRVRALTFERPESYRYNGRDSKDYLSLNTAKNQMQAPAKQEAITPATQLDFLHRTAMDAQASSEQIDKLIQSHRPVGKYPNGSFGRDLQTVAAMIGGGLATRVYYVSLGGFDTHAGEKGRHDRLMKELADGVSAFYADMKAQRNDQRVMMMTFSEFGRRVQQNASGGTDHGAAAAMLCFGGSLRQGIVGKHPSLSDLDHGDLKYELDFRTVYADILQNWLNTPSKPMLGQQFQPAGIVKT
jgi:uncharacterized protein (DUF1501 family)